MNDTTKQLEQLKNVRMSTASRARMREALSQYAAFHPEAEGVTIPADSRSSEYIQHVSVWSSLFTQTRLRTMKATLLATVLLLGGGTTVAAQYAVPGDVLYPVKVGVNENVRGAFAVGANAEARLQADLLAERIEEAEKLAARGELRGEMAARVETNITTQAQIASAAALAADADVRTEIAANIAQKVAVLDTVLGVSIAATTGDALARMETAADAVVALQADTDTEMATMLAKEISIDAQLNQAEARYESLDVLIASTAEFSAEVRAEFEQDLEVARKHLEEARTSLSAEARAAAQASIEAAHEQMGEMEAALSLMGTITIDGTTGHIVDIDLNGPIEAIILDANVSADAAVDAVRTGANTAVDAAGSVQVGF